MNCFHLFLLIQICKIKMDANAGGMELNAEIGAEADRDRVNGNGEKQRENKCGRVEV